MKWFKRKRQPKKTLWFATENPNKAKEIRELLPGYTIKTLADLPQKLTIEETGKTFEENALIKAKALAEKVNGIAIGEDSGLKIDKLDGFPGIYSKRWALPETDFKKINLMLLDKMKKAGLTGKDDRDAEFVSCIVLYNAHTKAQQTFKGTIGGEITMEPEGESTFGYDPIFKPFGYDQTFAQMKSELKNKMSHRKIAAYKLQDFLKNQVPGKSAWNAFLIHAFAEGE